MLKSLTCRKVPAAVKAFNEGSNTTMISAAATIRAVTTRRHISDFDPIGSIRSVQAPAAAGKKTAGFPLQEENDRHQYHDFPRDWRTGRLLQHLVSRADAEGGANRPPNAADA